MKNNQFLSDIYSLLKQVKYYIPYIFGERIKWEEINYKYFSDKMVEITNISYINGKVYIVNNGSIKIGKNFQANSGKNYIPIGGDTILRLVTHRASSKLVIGDNVGISNSTIVCWEKIEIGDNVMIGGSVKIWDTNFHSLDPISRNSIMDNDVKTSPIKICDNVFIGGSSIITKGVVIGKNSIIAAGSVVTKDIPDNVIAGGNPCKVIKQLEIKS